MATQFEECMEPMVDLRRSCPSVYLRRRSRIFAARRTVADRLNDAQSWLDLNRPGYQLEVMEAFRPVEDAPNARRLLQRLIRLKGRWDTAAAVLRRLLDRIGDSGWNPYASGGTLGVRLRDPNGLPAPVMPAIPSLEAARLEFPWLPALLKKHRQILRDAMDQGGFVNNEAAWWQWSYGDRLWAVKSGQPAIYGDVVRLRTSGEATG
jgi:D-alanyl-D-alanine dipeptidase